MASDPYDFSFSTVQGIERGKKLEVIDFAQEAGASNEVHWNPLMSDLAHVAQWTTE